MYITLTAIGIRFPEYRERDLDPGEQLRVYGDCPLSKGCTSPFISNWINEMVSRQG